MKTYERRSRPGGSTETAPKSTATDYNQSRGLTAWKRRHAASLRLLPLDCGCQDPWHCQCSHLPLTQRAIDAGRDAALHVLESGHTPVLQLEVLQALWRRGGADRQLAEELFKATGGQAA